MDTVKVDMQKLQLLNDRIAQTIDALNQLRLSVHGVQYTTSPLGGYGSWAPIGYNTQGLYGTPSFTTQPWTTSPYGVQPWSQFGGQAFGGQPFGTQPSWIAPMFVPSHGGNVVGGNVVASHGASPFVAQTSPSFSSNGHYPVTIY